MVAKRRRSTSPLSPTKLEQDDRQALTSALTSKKLKFLADHSTTSPYPNFQYPTVDQVQGVFSLLASHTPGGAPVHLAPSTSTSSNSADTCGHVPNVLDALIGTILSQNTSSANSSGAKSTLDDTFGRGEEGFGKMAVASRDEIATAIRSGGLANRKAKIIQEALIAIKKKHGRYDLQHLTGPGITDDQAMQELVSYDGVGPKTAACVLSFCLGRQAFAVDTHVFRLSRLLGWVPPSADRVGAQAHLELKVPPELKYGLHVMMVRHGRTCRGCKKEGAGACPLKTWLRDRGTRRSEIKKRVDDVS